MHLPVDVIEADLDGRRTWFVSTLVAHDVVRGRWLLALNGQFVGRHQFGPRAHPGDALIDVYDASLGVAQLIEVVRRARNGAHLPHPDITGTRSPQFSTSWPSARGVRLDGTRVGRVTNLTLRVLADALTVVV